MVRPTKTPYNKKTANYNFVTKDTELMNKMYIIAKREGITLTETYLRAFTEYAHAHLEGNYQTKIINYGPNSNLTEEQRINEIIKTYQGDYEVKWLDITTNVRLLGYKGKMITTLGRKIAKALRLKGVKITRRF